MSLVRVIRRLGPLTFALLTACAGQSEKTLAARSALDAGDPQGALKALDDELGVDAAQQLPEKTGGNNSLLLLDRSTVLQQLNHYQLSSRDLEICDKEIQVLDLSASAGADLGRYLFSDDVGPYKAPAYEKLMINTLNMVNYLVRGDLNGARVEARRLAVMQKFTRDSGDAAQALFGPGSYLAGFTFEKSDQPEESLRYYDEALGYGTYQSLVDPVHRLKERASYSSPRIRDLLANAPGTPQTDDAPRDDDGEILVIVDFGRVPAKFARRIPIGLALTYASGFISPADQGRANDLALQGLVTWVNYPELGQARGTYQQPSFMLDGSWAPLEGILAVDQEVKRAWEKARGAVVASAITRTLTRVVTGEVTKKVAGGGLLGEVLSLGAQATLTATDTPDTRSWATLPARMAFGRMRVHAGKHVVTLGASGAWKRQTVTIAPHGWSVVNLTSLN